MNIKERELETKSIDPMDDIERKSFSIIEQMEYPYFPLNHTAIEGCDDGNGGKFRIQDLTFEDVSFCVNCYEKTKIKPLVVPKLRVGHLKSFLV